MKKQLLTLFSAALLFTACSNDIEEFEVVNNKPTFTAQTDVTNTRTSLGEGNKILWSENDNLAMFLKNTTIQQYKVTAGVGTDRATISPITPGNAGEATFMHNIALYPYNNASLKLEGNNYSVSGINFPTDWICTETSENGPFVSCLKDMPMVAVSSNNNLQFQNLGAVLKFRVKAGKNLFGTFTKLWGIKLVGNNNETLSGNPFALFDKNDGSFNSLQFPQPNTSVNVKREKDKDFILNETTAKDIYVVIPPTNFTKGMQVLLYDDHGDEMKLETKPIKFERNKLYVFPEIPFVPFKMGGTLPGIKPEPA